MKRWTAVLLAVLVSLSMVLAACAKPTPEKVVVTKEVKVTQVVTKEVQKVVTKEVQKVVTPTPLPASAKPVTLNINWGTEPPTADPALATDTTSVDLISNIFMGLTRFDPKTGAVIPNLATKWEASADGLTWTFHMRNDVKWVHYNPKTKEFSAVKDSNGKDRVVNAHDVVYGVKRTIDPATASDYAYVLYIIKNAEAVNEGKTGVTLDDVGVKAVDDFTVAFTLEHPAGYFPAISGMWVAMPQPKWTIDAWGDKWTEPGLIDTNGPYAIESWVHGSELDLVKSPLWINAKSVQIQRVEGVMITEASTAFAMYENNQLDTTGVPMPDIDRVKADPKLSKEYYQAPELCTYYYGFTNNKPPFDDVRVRKAFVQSINRQALIDNVTKGGQLPATHFAPPGIFGAPPVNEVGLKYDPAAAKASLQAYLDDKGMTLDEFNKKFNLTLMHNTSEGHARIAAAIQQMWKDTLGADVRVENQEWKVYLKTIKKDTPLADMPHIWRLGWCADYPDENNWVYEVFNNQAGANRLRRGCVDATCTKVNPLEFDKITEQAGQAQDPAERKKLYYKAEKLLAEDEVAYAPIYFYVRNTITKPWLTRDYPALGGNNFYEWKIDWAAKTAAGG